MAAISERNTINKIHYAGNSELRFAFLLHTAQDDVEVIAVGGGVESQAIHPLSVAREKILYVRNQISQPSPTECCIAFDTLTHVPKSDSQGYIHYEISGKPLDMGTTQRLFWDMNHQVEHNPYRIRSASILSCYDSEETAWHDASIFLAEKGVSQLATDRGLAAYARHIAEFEHQFGNQRKVTDFAAGLHLEALLAMGYVEAIDDVPCGQTGFEAAAERAVFLASVGASHRILGPLTHDPMNHIVTFPHHQDRLALLEKYTGAR